MEDGGGRRRRGKRGGRRMGKGKGRGREGGREEGRVGPGGRAAPSDAVPISPPHPTPTLRPDCFQPSPANSKREKEIEEGRESGWTHISGARPWPDRLRSPLPCNALFQVSEPAQRQARIQGGIQESFLSRLGVLDLGADRSSLLWLSTRARNFSICAA
eukprot:1396756-Rhodomonas_salina.1